jgi:ABC-type transport system involved in multi-copper enzyme maturation permease subunit
MVFGLGPVLRYELITTGRRGRYYLARAVYGTVLLFLLWGQFEGWELNHPMGGSVQELHSFAESTFIVFARAQLATLLCLLPALVAGVIADEHQRKTLHYLLASRLSSAEIVLGKLGARLVHVGTFAALGLPVVCLLGLYGGLDPVKVFYVYFGTFTTVLSVAGFSIFISVLARRPRDAILAAYGLEALWLFGPPAIEHISRHLDGPLWWVKPVNDQLMVSNPVVMLDRMTDMIWYYRPGVDWLLEWFPWLGRFEAIFGMMAAMHLLAGPLFLTLAIVGLRPLRGGSWSGAEPRAGWWTRLANRARSIARHRAAAAVVRNELLASRIRRPPCGEHPMMWKERYAALGGGLKRLGGRPVVLVFSVLLGCYLFDVAYDELAMMVRGRRIDGAWLELNGALRSATAALGALGLLTIAASSAVAITGEREQDTWISLATTLLTPDEVIRAKQFGALWSARRIGLALLIAWAVGLLLGAIHPLGALLAAGIAMGSAWFAAAVGIAASASARNSTRALAATFITLLVLLNLWPFAMAGALLSPREIAVLWGQGNARGYPPLPLNAAGLATVVAFTAGYAAIAAGLTAWSIRRLSATWGRP